MLAKRTRFAVVAALFAGALIVTVSATTARPLTRSGRPNADGARTRRGAVLMFSSSPHGGRAQRSSRVMRKMGTPTKRNERA